MRAPFHLELVTSEAVLFAGEIDEISMRADRGEIVFLPNHEDYFGSDEVRTELVAVRRGIGDADEGQVTILADITEPGGEIDVDRARGTLSAERERLVAEGPATRSTTDDQSNESASPEHRSGAMVALLVPGSAEAVVTRATVRLEAAGAAATS